MHKHREKRHRFQFHLVFDDGRSFSAGIVRDVSASGLFLETFDPPEPGTELMLYSVEPVAQQLAGVRARVVRTVPEDPDTYSVGGMALEFVDKDRVQAEIEVLVEALRGRDRRSVWDSFLGMAKPSAGFPAKRSGWFRDVSPRSQDGNEAQILTD